MKEMNIKAKEKLEAYKEACVHFNCGECSVMKSEYCEAKEERCPFHQTEEERAASIAKYNAIMNAKDEDEQRYYAEKYHDGQMPWKAQVDDGQKE